VRDTAGLPAVASGDDKILDDERVAVEFDDAAVLSSVIGPALLAGCLLDRAEEAVAGTDEDEVPRDRGGGEDSTAGVVSPERLRIGHGFRCHKEHHHQKRGNAQRLSHPSRAHHGFLPLFPFYGVRTVFVLRLTGRLFYYQIFV
jgi:hypothetical protein